MKHRRKLRSSPLGNWKMWNHGLRNLQITQLPEKTKYNYKQPSYTHCYQWSVVEEGHCRRGVFLLYQI